MTDVRLDVAVGHATASDGVNNITTRQNDSAMSSMEQFITPVRIQKNHPDEAATPGFRGPSNKGDEDGKFGDDLVGPTLDELDPYFPKIFANDDENSDENDDGTKFMVKNDYRIINHNMVNNNSGDYNIRKAEDETPGTRAQISVVQPMSALRGPLIISGWGFGMDDFPAPSEGGNYPENTKFDEKMINNRARWKTGPVHLMWDDERQVWQGGYHIVCGVAAEAITAPPNVCEPTRFKVNLLRNTKNVDHGWDANGVTNNGKLSDILIETITVQNRDPSLEQEHVANAVFVIAIKLNYEWLPLWVGCPETPACEEEEPPCLVRSTCP